MKKVIPAIICFVLSFGFYSCNPITYNNTDLIGTWRCASEGLQPEGNYMYYVFSAEKTNDTTYPYYGKTWDEGDGVYEDQLTEKGNGWFKWGISGRDLSEIHFMEYGWADIPKIYTIKLLTETTFTYVDDFGKSHTLTRVK